MIQSQKGLGGMHADDVAYRYIPVGREPALVDDEIFHLVISVDRFHLLECIGGIQNTLDHAHNDDGNENANNRLWKVLSAISRSFIFKIAFSATIW